MAITGTGTHDDPFVVTTYSELVSKITNPDNLAGCYIKVGNDINIADEYPFGDMPTLDFGVNVFLDGDGKTITNWYHINNSPVINMKKYPCRMENLSIRNIIHKPVSSSALFLQVMIESSTNITNPLIDNCIFVGESFGTFCSLFSNSKTVQVVRSSVFNILCHGNTYFTHTSGGVYGLHFESCNTKIVSEGGGSGLLAFGTTHIPKNSYFDISIPNGNPTASNITVSDGKFDNCIIKLSTPLSSEAQTKSIFGASNSELPVSIINTSASPGVEPETATQLKEVTDQNWHDIAYLQSIGFSVGERTGGSE